MLFYRSIGLLCVFITSLLYRTYKEMTRSMSLSPAAGAVFLIPLYKCGLLCHFSTCSPTRSWGVGAVSAQNAQQALACHALLHYFFVKCYNEVCAGTFCTHTEICRTIRLYPLGVLVSVVTVPVLSVYVPASTLCNVVSRQ